MTYFPIHAAIGTRERVTQDHAAALELRARKSQRLAAYMRRREAYRQHGPKACPLEFVG